MSSDQPATQYYDVATAVSQGARDYQEDTLIAHFPLGQSSGFAIVADGMGGHAAGDIASVTVATEMFAQMCSNRDVLDTGAAKLPLALRDAAHIANQRLTAHVVDNPQHSGMGTTLLVPVFSGNKLHWISVGDSPLLLFRDGALRMLNKDHSLAAQIDMMVKSGVIDAESGRNHPDRNVLTSVLAGDEIAKIDCPATPLTLQANDIVIAASDGVQSLSNSAIANLLMEHHSGNAAQIVDALLTGVLALLRPDQDNVSICAIKVGNWAVMDNGLDPDEMPVLATGRSK